MLNIRNIIFGCPDPRELAAFYSGLLGMRIIREDWLVIAKDAGISPRLAFDEEAEYRRPRWPDPQHPQQAHLDVFVSDPDASEQLALRLGATTLQEQGSFRSYADPAGHPFCLYPDPTGRRRTDSGSTLGRVVFDCFSPRSLAAFYEKLLGGVSRTLDTQQRVELQAAGDGQPALAFQHAQVSPPRWPDPAYPQQIHLDFDVEDGRAMGDLALSLGAIRLPEMGGSCPVYGDPAAHPFCLCGPGE